MKILKALLAAAIVGLVTMLPIEAAGAWWGGPWSTPGGGPYGGYAERYDLSSPPGPSIADIRRHLRQEFYRSMGMPY